MIKYRLAGEGDAGRINKFHNQQYRVSRSPGEFVHFFLEAPAGKALYVLAEEGGEIIGTQCVIPILLEGSGGEHILSGKSEETLVAAEYRGKGVFGEMYSHLFLACEERGISAIWGFTSAVKPFLGIGFSAPFHCMQGIAVKDALRTSRYLAGETPGSDIVRTAAAVGLSALARVRLWVAAPPGEGEIREVEESEPWLCNSNQSLAAGHCQIHCSEEFVQWRVIDHPHYEIVRRWRYSDGKGNRSVEFICTFGKSRTAYILHVTATGDVQEDDLATAIRHLCKRLLEEDVIAIRVWAFSHNSRNRHELQAFRKAGFTILNRGMSFVWRDLTSGLVPEQFYLSKLAALQ